MDELLTTLSVAGFKTKFENNALSIVYDEISRPYLEKVLLDFSNIKGYQVRLATSNGHGEFLLGLNDKMADTEVLVRDLKGVFSSFDGNVNCLERLSDEDREIYNLFQNALKFEGKFGIGIQNFEDIRKLVIKTDIPELKNRLEKAGFIVEDGRIRLVARGDETFVNDLHMANASLEQELTNQEEPINVEEQEVIKPGESEVDIYEKYVKNEKGEDVVVRMSIVKQNKEDSEYERLVNISYLSPDGLVTSKEIFGYEDGYNFDENALPAIIDGFRKDVTSSGKKVEVSEVNSSKCYISAGDGKDSVSLDGYDVEYVQSIVAADKEHNLVGNADDTLDLSELAKNDVVEEAEILGENTFEEEVIGQDFIEDIPEENYENVETLDYGGKKMVKTLGTDPRMSPSNYGLVNYAGLIFFFVVDVLAIALGVYLLTR